ncbi:hypothetical protein QT231_02565 [Halomonas sp. SpR1]|uniref:hypothetical protein n=1 Tax=Halomonas sp. SpR1 TaxID=3050462 RepID=UPI0027E465DE|nr:hypothetical protein [Halomonas sp. SpR1]MDQ7731563.1 hypothetical protein [Halomonas sp. SpR1]
MQTVRILAEASQEAVEAAAWYEHEQIGLGSELFATLDAAFDVIEENLVPLSPLPDEIGYIGAKRLILDRFPCDVIAIELPEETVVIALAHQSRKLGYWRERSKLSGGL